MSGVTQGISNLFSEIGKGVQSILSSPIGRVVVIAAVTYFTWGAGTGATAAATEADAAASTATAADAASSVAGVGSAGAGADTVAGVAANVGAGSGTAAATDAATDAASSVAGVGSAGAGTGAAGEAVATPIAANGAASATESAATPAEFNSAADSQAYNNSLIPGAQAPGATPAPMVSSSPAGAAQQTTATAGAQAPNGGIGNLTTAPAAPTVSAPTAGMPSTSDSWTAQTAGGQPQSLIGQIGDKLSNMSPMQTYALTQGGLGVVQGVGSAISNQQMFQRNVDYQNYLYNRAQGNVAGGPLIAGAGPYGPSGHG